MNVMVFFFRLVDKYIEYIPYFTYNKILSTNLCDIKSVVACQ